MNAATSGPPNALIAEAVAVCERKGISLLVYGKYVYGRNKTSSLTEFKQRNGFREVSYPRYFVPLTSRGWWIVKSGLHRGLKDLIPGPMVSLLLDMRSRFYRLSAKESKFQLDIHDASRSVASPVEPTHLTFEVARMRVIEFLQG